MTSRVALSMLFLSLSCPSIMRGQSQPKVQTDIDPPAFDVLRAANQPISSAKSYSFKTVIGEEHLGTNNEVITLFHVTEAVVQQPDGGERSPPGVRNRHVINHLAERFGTTPDFVM